MKAIQYFAKIKPKKMKKEPMDNISRKYLIISVTAKYNLFGYHLILSLSINN